MAAEETDIFKKAFEYTYPQDMRKLGLNPYFAALSSMQGPEVMLEGRKTIMLGSNNYLGLTSDPEVIKAAADAVNKFGTGCSGSRFLNGTMTLHLDIEKELAKFLNKPAVLTFSTGFGANLAIISALVGRKDYVICDKENHASIYDACKLSYGTMLRYAHNDMTDLEEKLKNIPTGVSKLIVTDGVFSMGGDIANMPEICRLAKKYGARVMVDDAHALGILGAHGRGTAEHFNLEKEVDIYMGTFSKSLASLGGYMAGDEAVVNYVQHHARPFIFTASMTPASAAAALTAIRIMDRGTELKDKLISISKYAAESFEKAGLPIMKNDEPTPIVPIKTGEAERTFRICVKLMENGVYVNPVIPPAVPSGQCIIRTSYTAAHTKDHIDRATAIIKKVFDEIK